MRLLIVFCLSLSFFPAYPSEEEEDAADEVAVPEETTLSIQPYQPQSYQAQSYQSAPCQSSSPSKVSVCEYDPLGKYTCIEL